MIPRAGQSGRRGAAGGKMEKRREERERWEKGGRRGREEGRKKEGERKNGLLYHKGLMAILLHVHFTRRRKERDIEACPLSATHVKLPSCSYRTSSMCTKARRDRVRLSLFPELPKSKLSKLATSTPHFPLSQGFSSLTRYHVMQAGGKVIVSHLKSLKLLAAPVLKMTSEENSGTSPMILGPTASARKAMEGTLLPHPPSRQTERNGCLSHTHECDLKNEHYSLSHTHGHGYVMNAIALRNRELLNHRNEHRRQRHQLTKYERLRSDYLITSCQQETGHVIKSHVDSLSASRHRTIDSQRAPIVANSEDPSGDVAWYDTRRHTRPIQ